MNGIQEVSGSIPLISTTVNFGHAIAWPLDFLTPSVKQKTALRSRLSPPVFSPLVLANGYFYELNKQTTALRFRLSPPPGNPPWNCVPGLFHFLLASIEHPLQQVIAEGVCINYQYVKLSQLQSCLLTQSSSLVSVLPGQVHIGATKVTISSGLLVDGTQQIQLADDAGGAQRKVRAD